MEPRQVRIMLTTARAEERDDLGDDGFADSTVASTAVPFLNRELDLWFIFDRLRGNPRLDALLEN